jgi:nicotinamidase-related amidase
MTERFTIGEQDVLLAVDIQNDFCPGGNLAVPRGDEVVPIVNRLARQFAHVVLTQDWHPRGHLSFAPAVSDHRSHLWQAGAVAGPLRAEYTWRGLP